MINSRGNEFIKYVRSLKDKKFRDLSGEYTAEGIKSVSEAIACGADIRVIAVTTENAERFSAFGIEIKEISADVFKAISEEVTPQGVLAVIKKPAAAPVKAENCVYLDGVSDPANVGAIIRTAAACGIKNILFAEGCADPYSAKSVRASMGGIFRVNCVLNAEFSAVKKLGIPLVVADMGGENVFGAVIPSPFCVCVGNEAHGVSKELKQAADRVVAIPMQNGMESLNAAVSASVIVCLLTNKT